jgi:hypothetical protein
VHESAKSETGVARGSTSSGSPWGYTRLHRQQTFALQLFAGELPGATDGFRSFPNSPLGGFFVMPTELHLAEDALALHFPFQRLEGLIDIVVADENLHVKLLFDQAVDRPDGQAIWAYVDETYGTNRRRQEKSLSISGQMLPG